MKHLKQLFRQQLKEVRSSTVIVLLVIAMLGFADAAYLTVEHYRGVIPPCSVTEGCEKVLTSAYSVALGMPVSLLGSLYYLAIAVGAFMYIESKHGRGEIAAHHAAILKWTMLATVLGFLMSLWFIIVQVFILHSYCIYCLGSALASISLFIVAVVTLKRYGINDTHN